MDSTLPSIASTNIINSPNITMTSASSTPPAQQQHQPPASKRSHNKRVRFDERCRVRPIKTRASLEPAVREKMWYNREELQNIRKECRMIMKEALHQLQRAQAKLRKEQAQEKLLQDDVHSSISEPEEKKQKKHLFRPSAFRGLEMFHPKMSFRREGRRQEQWEVLLTEQAQQDMLKKSSHMQLEEGQTKPLPKEEDLLQLANLSLNMTEIAAKEAHRRALRDEQDLLHPPKYWMLPWLLKKEEEEEEAARASSLESFSQLEKLLQRKRDCSSPMPRSPASTKVPLANASELKNMLRTVM